MIMDLYTIRNELMAGKSIYDLNLRVTYYTRVSTLSSEQLHSLQMTYSARLKSADSFL
mgnify:CR=1 FL=1